MGKTYIASINTVENDPVDRRCGGPAFLGFDFVFEDESGDDDPKFMAATWFREVLRSYDIPCRSVSVKEYHTDSSKYVWTPDEMVQNIRDNAAAQSRA